MNERTGMRLWLADTRMKLAASIMVMTTCVGGLTQLEADYRREAQQEQAEDERSSHRPESDEVEEVQEPAHDAPVVPVSAILETTIVRRDPAPVATLTPPQAPPVPPVPPLPDQRPIRTLLCSIFGVKVVCG